jgi:hypothetical protein
VRHLTLKEVTEQYGGTLPADAVFRPDEGEPTTPVPAARTKHRRARSGRFAVLNAFTDFALSKLTAAEVKVWLILFRDTKAATCTARTGQADIARRAGIDTRTVRRALVTLEAKGLVRVVRRGRLNAGSSVYRVYPTGSG